MDVRIREPNLIILNDQGGGVIDISNDVTATLRAQGHGHPPVICLEGNGARPSHRGGGYSEDGRMFTLNTIEKHAVCYGISSMDSNAMKSPNPHSGIYEAKTSRTLDLNGGNPSCNQGGVLVVYENQNCQSNNERAYALQTKGDDHHISVVCYDARGNGEGGVAPTITGDHNGHLNDYMAVVVLGNSNTAATITEDGTVPTLLGVRGGARRRADCHAGRSTAIRRTADSKSWGGATTTRTVKIAKGSADGPLILIEESK